MRFKYINIEFSIDFQKFIQLMNRMNEGAKARISLTTQDSLGISNSLKNTENSKQARSTVVCRICLEESPNIQELATFVKPCRCSGSLEYVHHACLLQWLNTMVKRRVELGQPLQNIHCQICQQQLQIEFKKKYVCRDNRSIQNRIKVYWPYAIVSLIFILLTLGGMGALAVFQKNYMKADTKQETVTLTAIFIVAWVLLSLSLIVWTAKIIKNFLIKKETYIGSVQSKACVAQGIVQNNPFIQSFADSQEPQIPSNDVSNAESTLVRRRVKVIPLKPAFRNQSADRLGEQLNDNPNPWR